MDLTENAVLLGNAAVGDLIVNETNSCFAIYQNRKGVCVWWGWGDHAMWNRVQIVIFSYDEKKKKAS